MRAAGTRATWCSEAASCSCTTSATSFPKWTSSTTALRRCAGKSSTRSRWDGLPISLICIRALRGSAAWQASRCRAGSTRSARRAGSRRRRSTSRLGLERDRHHRPGEDREGDPRRARRQDAVERANHRREQRRWVFRELLPDVREVEELRERADFAHVEAGLLQAGAQGAAVEVEEVLALVIRPAPAEKAAGEAADVRRDDDERATVREQLVRLREQPARTSHVLEKVAHHHGMKRSPRK